MMPRAIRPGPTLLSIFRQNGYIRTANRSLRKAQGTDRYKKGSEVRLVVATRSKANEVARLLRAVGLKPGRCYPKHGQVVQPAYGETAVEWFLSAEQSRPAKRRKLTARRRPR